MLFLKIIDLLIVAQSKETLYIVDYSLKQGHHQGGNRGSWAPSHGVNQASMFVLLGRISSVKVSTKTFLLKALSMLI